MKVQFELAIGENKFTLTEDVENHTDFFEKLHFYSTLPKVGPNGETDLVLRYRVAQGKYKYYSIVSAKAGKEFKFGQPKEGKGILYGKGWEPIYVAEHAEGEEGETAVGTSVGLGGLGAPVAQAPTPAPAAKQTTVATVGLGATTKATPAPAATQTAAPTQAPPQVQNQAANILAKFGI